MTGFATNNARLSSGDDPAMRKSARQKSLHRKREVARAFGNAASSYDRYAILQHRVAHDLAQFIAGKRVAAPYLEIGCGTGFLGAALEDHLAGIPCLFTDLSLPMVARCRERLEASVKDASFAVMDGEMLAIAERYGLVAASLVFQWFENLPAAIVRLADCLVSGGRLAFTMLGEGSLQEWRVACDDHGVESGIPSFPTARELEQAWPGGGEGWVEEVRIPRCHVSAIEFLHELKAIGAHVPDPAHVPQAPGKMRALLREIDSKNGNGENGASFSVTYHVLYGVFTRNGGAS
jgi:malonyl-CoA O-methyltransferase